MVTMTIVAFFLVLALFATLAFISGGVMAARSDARDEQLYRALLTSEA